MSLTKEQMAAYVDIGGGFCPYCGGDALGGEITIETGVVFQEMSCLDCEQRWRDVYYLDHVSEEAL